MGIDIHDHEGRLITLEYPDFYLVTVDVPNAKQGLERLPYRMQWDDDFRSYVSQLKEKKMVIICGDFNVCHQEIDIKNPKANEHNAGFTIEERNAFTTLLNKGYIDTFRYLYPDTVKYSWWSYRFNARLNNAGWRIDYFVVSSSLINNVKDSIIHNEIFGSDHCPIELVLEI
jgi:exodeoxyribonuclease-3